MLRVIDNHSYDYTPNWTPLGPITIFNYLHGTLNFLVMYVNQNFNFKFYKGVGGVDFHVNKWIHMFNSKSPIKKHRESYFSLLILFYNPSFVRYITHMVKVLNSMTRSVCVTYNVFDLCILHDTNLALRGSHHQKSYTNHKCGERSGK